MNNSEVKYRSKNRTKCKLDKEKQLTMNIKRKS